MCKPKLLLDLVLYLASKSNNFGESVLVHLYKLSFISLIVVQKGDSSLCHGMRLGKKWKRPDWRNSRSKILVDLCSGIRYLINWSETDIL